MNQLIEDLEDLFDNAPCGYVSTGPGGHIIMANRIFADWLGCARSDLIGRRFQDFLNIAGKMYYETHFAPLMRMQGFFHEVALDLVRADGSKLPVLVNAVERRDEKGALSFVRITIFNASDRRRYERELLEARRCAEKANAELQDLNRTLEERVAEAVEARMKSEAALRQAQKMEAVGQLTGGIAHDFNNMLAVVFSALNLLERRLAKGEDVSYFIAAAKDGAGRAAALTQRLLAFSRQQALAPEPICANQMVAGMSDLLHHTLGEMVRLETVLAKDLWQVLADKNVLENVVLNLAINARDAMPHGGRLVIETANSHLDEAYGAEHDVKPGQYVMVAVTDTGAGMSPEVMAKAFDPFFTTKEPGRGTGLGLSQVFGFVKQSEGHITVNSVLGRGTSITIYLPRYSGAPEARNHSEAQIPVRGNGSETVLVVEDDEQVLTLTAQMLRDLGYRVVEARGGEEALGALSAVPAIGLLFTDVVMPDINGLRLAEAALERRPDLKVLFTTGYTRDAVVHNRLLDPGVNLLQKPASLEQLAAKVRTLLDG
ncbi:MULTISPECIES: PAS domain-containing hybrid sensor histidine kinase/response regulator [Phyllobacteriaceae]|uniref:histidine kinase n=1 Tax=Phyllobacterium phragmitis TaxID=2670329 RepID=A0ABQ0H5B5_9HYPH|nr:PAS domain-containing hybrid sensor histidine kinase/response regulator [Mesorhizobium sp. RMAD-H1]MBB2974347.1 PAS domain S-box-containing protein [Mesorhizobium sp. RMAD-H1]